MPDIVIINDTKLQYNKIYIYIYIYKLVYIRTIFIIFIQPSTTRENFRLELCHEGAYYKTKIWWDKSLVNEVIFAKFYSLIAKISLISTHTDHNTG